MPNRIHSPSVARKNAFTILELVVTLSIVVLLMTIGGAAFISQRGKAREDKARGELQVIQQALESYKARFGDYPKIAEPFAAVGVVGSPEAYLLNALFGKIGPTGQEIRGIPPMLNSAVLTFNSRELPLANGDIDDEISNLKNNWIVDPWGTAYEYNSSPELNSVLLYGYTLRSAGPDRSFDTEDDLIAK